MQEPVELARELARIARENQLAEIEYREENTVLRLIFEPKKKFVQAATVAAAAPSTTTTVVVEEATAPTAPAAPTGLTINSPLAGVFYRSPRSVHRGSDEIDERDYRRRAAQNLARAGGKRTGG